MTQQEEIIRENLSQTFPAGSFDLFIAYLKETVGIKNINEEQAIQIANAISQINAPNIRFNGSDNVGNWKLPLILNDKEIFNLINTNREDKTFYISSQLPATIKSNGNFNPVLNNGEYIILNIQDNFVSTQKLYKNIQKYALLGTGNHIQFDKVNFGSDLKQAEAVNFEVVNQTNSTFRFRAEVPYASKDYPDILPNNSKLDSFTPYTDWDYFYPYWGADLRSESQNIILELWKADMSQLIANIYAYAGDDYQGWKWITGIYPQNWDTRDYKLIIKYQ